MRLIADGCVEREGVPGLARRLGYSERQLNRLMTEELGAGPLAIARAQRAHTARLLIETTDLALTDVAFAAGFGSVRQFNDTIREVFATSPTDLRARVGRRSICRARSVGGRRADGRVAPTSDTPAVRRRRGADVPRPARVAGSRVVGRLDLSAFAEPARWPRRHRAACRGRSRGGDRAAHLVDRSGCGGATDSPAPRPRRRSRGRRRGAVGRADDGGARRRTSRASRSRQCRSVRDEHPCRRRPAGVGGRCANGDREGDGRRRRSAVARRSGTDPRVPVGGTDRRCSGRGLRHAGLAARHAPPSRGRSGRRVGGARRRRRSRCRPRLVARTQGHRAVDRRLRRDARPVASRRVPRIRPRCPPRGRGPHRLATGPGGLGAVAFLRRPSPVGMPERTRRNPPLAQEPSS